jgi:hypothetical protein
MEPPRDGADPLLVFRAPLDEMWNATDWLTGGGDEKAEAKDDDGPGPSKKHGLSDKLKRLLPLLWHEFNDIDGFDEKEIRYGEERSNVALLPKIRLKRRKRAGSENRGRSLAAYPWLKRLFPRIVSYDEETEARKFVFSGFRPSSVHILGRVLETDYRFRLEDLSRFATHGDHVLHVLEHVEAGSPCLDQDAILYTPAIDSFFPFKFVITAQSKVDNYLTFVTTLRRIFDKTESVDSFLDRFYGELKLGFEKFGPACATPEFQEVELRLWTLVSYASTRLQILVAEMVHTVDGPKIRMLLKNIRQLHQAIDDCANLPSELCAFYRTRFDIPFSQLFQHSLAGIDEIAKSIDAEVKARPRDIETLTEMITRFRRIEPADPIENLEDLDQRLVAAYEKKEPPERVKATWVRRYNETIFTGTDKFDQRRYKPLEKPKR